MGKNVEKNRLPQKIDEKSLTNSDFSESDIKKLFNNYDKKLLHIFIDTLSMILKKIGSLVERLDESEAKVDCMLELDRIFQSANYMGITWIANVITEMKLVVSKAFEGNQKEHIQFKVSLENDIAKLSKVVHYWERLQDIPVDGRGKDDDNALIRFSKEDEELIKMYTDMLDGHLQDIYNLIIQLKSRQNVSENLITFKNIYTQLSISTNFMNYLELSAVIQQGLFILDDFKNHDIQQGINKIIKIYNTLLNNVKIQFSSNQAQWDKYGNINPLY